MYTRFLFSALFFTAAAAASAQVQLQQLWSTDTVFKVPESVRYSKAHNTLFVANIEGTQPWGKDGAGSIGKLSPDGKVINAEWVKGFDAPKGMAMNGNKIIVADLQTVKTVDVKLARIVNTLQVEGAQTLNDVTIDANRVVFVSDSRGKKVFRIAKNKVEIWLDSTHGLRGPNGLLAHKGELYVLDAGSLYKTGANKELIKIAEGMEGGTDGIEAVTDDSFIVSCWGGVIYYVKTDGTKQLLLDTRMQAINSADIGYDPEKKIIYVPTFWKNNVVAYQLK